MKPGENPRVGLILCAEVGAAEAHNALDNLPNEILAADYRTVLPDETLSAESKVPSAVGPFAHNFLFNPAHPSADAVQIVDALHVKHDDRILKLLATSQEFDRFTEKTPRPDGLTDAIENSTAEVSETNQLAVPAKPGSEPARWNATRVGSARATVSAGG